MINWLIRVNISMLYTFLIIFLISTSEAEVKIDISCLEDFDLKGISNLEQQKNLQHNLQIAEKSITWCEYRHPFIKSFTSDWRRASHNLRIYCENSNGVASYKSAVPRFLKGDSNSIILRSPSSKTVLSKQYLESNNYAIQVLIHELFHGTPANNMDNHNSLDENYLKCDGNSQLEDRVNILGAICSGNNEIFEYKSAEKIVFDKINKCGLSSCTKIFTRELNFWNSLFLESTSLSEEDALKMCRTIYLRAACKNKKGIFNFSSSKVLNNPYIIQLQKDLKENISKLPTDTVPLSFLEINPGLKLGYESLKSSKCFKQSFKIENNKLICKNPQKSFHNCEILPQGECTLKTSESLKKFQSYFSSMVVSRDITKFIAGKELLNFYKALDFFNKIEIKRALGASRVSRYINLLNKFHPAPLQRNCELLNNNELLFLVKSMKEITKAPEIILNECK